MMRVLKAMLLFAIVPVSFAQEGGTENSEWMSVGNTWFESQGNGTLGRLIALGTNGDVHFVWTRGVEYTGRNAHAYYNCWDESSGSLLSDTGAQMNLYSPARFPTVALHSSGVAISTFNEPYLSGPSRLSVALDFFPCTAAFTPYIVSEDTIVIWPKVDVDPFDRIHVVATTSDEPRRHCYMRASIDDTSNFEWELNWDIPLTEIASVGTNFPTVDIACSRNSQRVARAWIQDQEIGHVRSNVMLDVSEDGGLNWSSFGAFTNLGEVDTACVSHGGDPVTCNGDTFRPYQDLSILFDNNDNVHVAFTTYRFHYFDINGDEPNDGWHSAIWHWSEESFEFSVIGTAWYDHESANFLLGPMCRKPSLAIDTTTGYLFCAFQQYDHEAYGPCETGIGEYYLTVSQDNGRHWAVPTNVSNTPGEPNMQGGETPSEQDISLAKYITDGYVHALYMHDYAAGYFPNIECGDWLNAMIYMKTPVTDVPTEPLNPDWQFHASGTPTGEAPEVYPESITLYPNFPNPFNASTTLQFDLVKSGSVRLIVIDVTGREVAVLVDKRMSAGTHQVEFEGPNLASGVYFAKLEFGGSVFARKMVLLK